MSNNWSTQIVSDSTSLSILTPKFKGCKTKKEIFLEEFSDTWYKAPYKYQCEIEIEPKIDNLKSHIDLVFENGTKITANPNEKACVTACNGNITNGKCVLGPFQFNICSYKQEGKKFRLVLFVCDNEKTLAFTVSPPFLIRAKKVKKIEKLNISVQPIIRPGLKRKREDEDEDETVEPQRPASKLPPLTGLTPMNSSQQFQQFQQQQQLQQLQYQQQQQHQLQQQYQQHFQPQHKSLDLESDLDKLIEDTWEVIVNPVEDTYQMYQVMSLDDKKQLLQMILANSTLAERELLISKLVKNIKTGDLKTESNVEKYFTDFGDLNMENM